MLRVLHCLALAALVAAAVGARAQMAPGGIYACVDAQGRHITADRPIAECMDREQKLLNGSGTVRRTVPPSLTASERAERDERERRRAEEELRRIEERRLDRALLGRYPGQEAHDAERAKALQAVQNAIDSGHRRTAELREQRRRLDQETEFYKSPAKWPAGLKHRVEENQQQIEAQERFIAGQDEERRRVNARFDEELARLKSLWAQRAAAAAAAGGPAAPSR
ncbi:DUF4124 domain-containing protein [Ramlibacter sp.]|uniref:DUF4124 domain-containing protein n=1 Tax=Ramlibacter sp. TaxID=1917967 RepID=UPI0026212FC3|nr:DUF4124 domain-containing protein [Ramlibacter sp.]MDB5954267.1 hypothetical protein [Ramlibacter sp.]